MHFFNDMSKDVTKQHPVYLAFKAYLRFIHDKIYYRKTYKINAEAIPPSGTPTLILSNHQNCLNDPLGILFSFRDRKAMFITRADVFALSPIANKFLRAIGLLPAFRINYEGAEALKNNGDTFKISEEELVNGRTLIMYPEAGHQNKRWLGNFSLGYARLAFEAAAMHDFKTDIIVLPSCNHYENYFGLQTEFMVKFGTPIHLQDYYELYKTKPRTAQRKLNEKVREQISDLMLNITDLDNYEAIDFIREIYRKQWALKKNMECKDLPSKLLVDKSLCAALEKTSAEKPDSMQTIYASALRLKQLMSEARIDEKSMGTNPSAFGSVMGLIACVLTFPLWIFSLWPAIFNYWCSMLVFKLGSKDPMFKGTFLYAINALFFIPIFYILTLIVTGIQLNWLVALVYVLILPLLTLFAIYWRKLALRFLKNLRFSFGKNKGKVKEAKDLRAEIFEQLNKLL